MKYLLFFLILAFLTSGCSSARYPVDWVKKIPSANFLCENFSGYYSNPADLATEPHHIDLNSKTTIESILNNWTSSNSPNYFTISFPKESILKFEIFNLNQIKYEEIVYTKGKDYTCKDNHIELKGTPDPFTIPPSKGHCINTIFLYLGEDGSLIANYVSKCSYPDAPGEVFNQWSHFKKRSNKWY